MLTIGACLFDPLTEALRTLGTFIVSSTMVGIATIIGTVIAITRYLSGPELLLDVKIPTSHARLDGRRVFNPRFFLVNAGNTAAEDVSLSITVCDCEFTTEDEAVVFDKNSKDKGVKETPLKIEDERILPFIGVPDCRYDYEIGNPIYSDDRFKLYYGKIEVEQDGCYKVEYTTACKGHGPRQGAVYLCISGDQATVHREDPSTWRTWIRNIVGSSLPEDQRTQRVR